MLTVDKEFKNLIPPLTAEEFAQLEANILAEGIREPIIVWENTIVDGHNRYEIACKHNIEYEIAEKEFDNRDQVIDWMINNQLGRRNLSKETQSYLRGLQYEREKKKQGTNNQYVKSEKDQNDLFQNTAQKLAQQHGVSEPTIKRDAEYAKAVDTITANTAPEVKSKILNREIEITKKDTEKNTLSYLRDHVDHTWPDQGKSGMVYWSKNSLRLLADKETIMQCS